MNTSLINELKSQCIVREQRGTTAFNNYMVDRFDTEKFAELIMKECLSQCEKIAVEADAMTKSKFVTDAGRMLHEGMWGGAKNCTAEIKQHFGVEE